MFSEMMGCHDRLLPGLWGQRPQARREQRQHPLRKFADPYWALLLAPVERCTTYRPKPPPPLTPPDGRICIRQFVRHFAVVGTVQPNSRDPVVSIRRYRRRRAVINCVA
jgi:hypothetical protein